MTIIERLIPPVAGLCAAACLAAPLGVQAQGSATAPADFAAFTAASSPVAGPRGTTLVAGGMGRFLPSRALAVARMNPDGTPDTTFGAGGIATLTVWGASESARYVVAQHDGRWLVGGFATDPSARCASGPASCSSRYVALFRLEHNGVVDTAFGVRGRVLLALRDGAGFDRTPLAYDVVPDRDGTIVLRAVIDPYGEPTPLTVRIAADGRVDPTTSLADHFTVQPHGLVAVQFRHVLMDHYFVTANPDEIASLDRREEAGWIWEGDGFRVFAPGVLLPGTVPVCRFYGRPEFGIDSHFVSANADECRGLEASADGAWLLESREVFRVRLPNPSTGACTDGDATRIFRLWNARLDSNHYFTNRKAFRDWYAEGRGYVSEGWGAEGVAMCGAPPGP